MPREHFTGSIMRDIVRQVSGVGGVIIDQQQQNAMYGVHQARVRIPGDDRPYRLVLAPEDAPLAVKVQPPTTGFPAGALALDQHFTHPLAKDFAR